MDNKFYVSYEAARLLKEKGYNEETDYVIDDEVKELMRSWRTNEAIPEEFADYFFSCPTKSEAIDWLEESKGITISPHPVTILREDGTTEIHWSCHIVQKDGTWYTTNDLPTRLEAEEAAIIKALELL